MISSGDRRFRNYLLFHGSSPGMLRGSSGTGGAVPARRDRRARTCPMRARSRQAVERAGDLHGRFPDRVGHRRGDRAGRLRRGQHRAAADRQQRSGRDVRGADRIAPTDPCTYCNRCLVNVVENPLGCYEESRFPSREAMVAQIMSVFNPPPFV